MFDVKPDDIFSKTDMLLYDVLQELKQLNKSLHPMRKDTEIKTKPKVRSTKPKQPKKPKEVGVQNGSNTNHG